MQEVCVWCGEEVADDGAVRGNRVAYAVCPSCSLEQARETGLPLESFLARLPVRILLVDRHARVQRANVELACDRDATWQAASGLSAGDVLECTHALEAEGCGGTAACSGCTLQRTIARSWESGEAHADVPCLLQVWRDGSPEMRSFRITTRRVGGWILLGFTPELAAVMDDFPPEHPPATGDPTGPAPGHAGGEGRDESATPSAARGRRGGDTGTKGKRG